MTRRKPTNCWCGNWRRRYFNTILIRIHHNSICWAHFVFLISSCGQEVLRWLEYMYTILFLAITADGLVHVWISIEWLFLKWLGYWSKVQTEKKIRIFHSAVHRDGMKVSFHGYVTPSHIRHCLFRASLVPCSRRRMIPEPSHAGFLFSLELSTFEKTQRNKFRMCHQYQQIELHCFHYHAIRKQSRPRYGRHGGINLTFRKIILSPIKKLYLQEPEDCPSSPRMKSPNEPSAIL